MAKPIAEIDRELEPRVEALGYELVDAEWAGSSRRPIVRIRVDRPDSKPGDGVTVADCARVSRRLEEWLDENPGMPERYVLEVSSPGVERPLRRRRDFERFAEREVVVERKGDLPEEASGSLQGILEGVEEEDDGYRVVLRLPDGSGARVRRDQIVRANLVFRWKEED